MSWFCRFVSSSLGKKYLMGITGLLLSGFLVTHLAGNLLMYVGDGGKTYNKYAETLHSQPGLILLAEIGLLLLFLLHLGLAWTLTWKNAEATGVNTPGGTRYHGGSKTKEGSEIAPARVDTWMMISGIAIFAFLVVHLSDFHFQASPDITYTKTVKQEDGTEKTVAKESFEKAIAVLENPLHAAIYVVGTLFLCAHLSHGFASAFRSLGISHPKYNRCIRICGYIFAVVFGLGFATFPIWANLR